MPFLLVGEGRFWRSSWSEGEKIAWDLRYYLSLNGIGRRIWQVHDMFPGTIKDCPTRCTVEILARLHQRGVFESLGSWTSH